jgi:hypothetical protein
MRAMNYLRLSLAAVCVGGCTATPTTDMMPIPGQPGCYTAKMCIPRDDKPWLTKCSAQAICPPEPKAAAASPAQLTPVAGTDQLAIALPTGFVLRSAPENLKAVGAVFYAINGTLDIGVTVIPQRNDGVADLTAYASTRRAREADALKDATWTDVARLEIGGHHAAQFKVTGTTSSNLKVTYVSTFIEGHDQIVFVNAWSGATNAIQQMTVLESLAATVSGIS